MTPSADDKRAPASQEVADVLRAEIRSGALAAGAKLPSVRQLAEKFKVAPMTAQSAVEILRADGLIYTSPGRGSFVRDELPPDDPGHSPEYLLISEHLHRLDRTVQELSERLADLERHGNDRQSAE
ncbi:GntR family transcriptional regulator [Yinghuangia sp. YIM S09857]|uniref:GntR family transcriptional regulator n=1 Tax=Yinghuangia sp. YIM S09857 TaxID=3436929 RepID=UPI003F52D899